MAASHDHRDAPSLILPCYISGFIWDASILLAAWGRSISLCKSIFSLVARRQIWVLERSWVQKKYILRQRTAFIEKGRTGININVEDINTPSDYHRYNHLLRYQDAFNDVEAHLRFTSIDSLPDYTYKALPKAVAKPFRVLTILPGTGSTPLACQIELADIDKPPRYEALSYCWGQGKSTSSLICGNTRLLIRDNLWDALYRIRRKHTPRRIWVDAICINQQDIHEREHQVRLMNFIYRRATKVLAWLGNEHSQLAVPLLAFANQTTSSIHQQDMRHQGSLEGVPIDLGPRIGNGRLDSQALRDYSKSWGLDWSRSGFLFDAAWFSRLWVIQEVTLASDIEVLWGSVVFNWLIIRRTASMFGGYARELDDLRLVSENAKNVPIMTRSPSFLGLLETTRLFGVTDPRDHVFALLGMTTEDANPDAGELFLEPDYDLSLADLDLKLAHAILKTSTGLTLLSHVRHGADIDQDYPTWVPKWQGDPMYTLNGDYGRFTFEPGDFPGFSVKGNTLLVDGVQYGQVKHIGPVMPKLPTAYRTSKDNVKTRARTLSDWPAIERILDGCDMSDLIGLMKFSHSHTLPNYSGNSASWIRDVWAQNSHEGLTSQLNSSEDQYLDRSFAEICSGKRFFKTACGKVGIGPEALRPDDILCFFRAFEFPFALRKQERHYLLVGECSVPDKDRNVLFSERTQKVPESDVCVYEIH